MITQNNNKNILNNRLIFQTEYFENHTIQYEEYRELYYSTYSKTLKVELIHQVQLWFTNYFDISNYFLDLGELLSR